MADHLTWLSVKRPALDAAIAGASPLLKTVGNDIKNILVGAGTAFDSAFPDEIDTGETPAHVTWRAQIASILEDLDSLAAAADGRPATTIDPANPLASERTVRTRAAVLAGGATPPAKPISFALSRASLPPEPPRFATLDAALGAAIATVDAFVAAV